VKAATETFRASDGHGVHLYRWEPDAGTPRAVVQIAHGMGEHAARYVPIAERLCEAGHVVYANDHRGHGRSVARSQDLGDMGTGGWNRAVQDLLELNQNFAQRHPRTPRILFGHSMGALLARHYLVLHGATLSGAILSGTTDGGGFQLWLARWLAAFERWRLGADAESAALSWVLFGRANKKFDPGRTGFEWLSRDPAQVDAYVEDPLCGFVVRAGSLCEMFEGLRWERRLEQRVQIPPDLPVYVFVGADDPFNRELVGLRELLDSYQSAGLRNVDHQFYDGGRHEMLNEINRDEVYRDVVRWIDGILPS